MKRFLGFMLLLLTLNACDDGDFDIESFDFSAGSSNQCNSGVSGFFIYKINSNEVLLIQIPEINFVNEITDPDSPRTVAITSTNKVIYRIYNGTLTTSDICTTIPPATPVVIEEWNAVSGTIEIQTNVNKTIDATLNSSVITGYTHTIVLRNVNFLKGNGNQQLYQTLSFGNYVTSATQPANFAGFTINPCGNNYSFTYKISGRQTLTFASDSNLFQPVVTPEETPITTLLNESNRLQINFYNDNVNDDFVCSSTPLTYPVLQKKWISDNGQAGVSGMIEVRTFEEYEIPTDNTSPLVGYRHKVTFKKVTMSRDAVSFKLGDVYEFGEFVIPL